VHSVGAVEGVVQRPRLHGLVFALRSGVPALAIDPVPGGAKVSSQAAAVGWLASLRPDELGRPRRAARLWGGAERVRGELLAVLGPPA
jgi:hypothetical protein